MPPPGIRISGLRGCLSDEALLERRLDLALEGGVLRATEAGLRRLIPPGGRVSLEQISAASIRLRVSSTLVSAAAEIRPLVGENGFLGLEILSARAAGARREARVAARADRGAVAPRASDRAGSRARSGARKTFLPRDESDGWRPLAPVSGAAVLGQRQPGHPLAKAGPGRRGDR